jgi:hypothetical protein
LERVTFFIVARLSGRFRLHRRVSTLQRRMMGYTVSYMFMVVLFSRSLVVLNLLAG